MFSTSDTIVAIATPPGRGGIGVVRISGPGAQTIASHLALRNRPFEPRHATLAEVAAQGSPIDRAVFTYFPRPHSYTGEDVVEISAHGSPVILRAIVESAMHHGARLAEPGEFTFRAYLNERIDLVQAEAVRDLVDAVTPLQARAAFDQLEGTLTSRIRDIDAAVFELSARVEASLDFPEEGYHFITPATASEEILDLASSIDALLADARRGRLVREGAQVVIVGRPNSGKSSLFNQLAGTSRAIVTEIAGTTRDLVTEVIDIGGAAITLVDTAGVRTAAVDVVEQEGIARAHGAAEIASVIVVVLDRSVPLQQDDRLVLSSTLERPRVVVANKCDLPSTWHPADIGVEAIEISARRGEGIDAVRAAIHQTMSAGDLHRDVPSITNTRHADLLAKASAALRRAGMAAADGTPEEFVAADLSEARTCLEEVTGARTPDDVLASIFSRFCIGK